MASRPRASRRRWSVEFKKRVVAEASQPGVSNAEIARKYDLNANLLFNWKNKFGDDAVLVPVEITPDRDVGLPLLVSPRADDRSVSTDEQRSVLVELPCGIRVRCGSDVSATRLAEIIAALRSKA